MLRKPFACVPLMILCVASSVFAQTLMGTYCTYGSHANSHYLIRCSNDSQCETLLQEHICAWHSAECAGGGNRNHRVSTPTERVTNNIAMGALMTSVATVFVKLKNGHDFGGGGAAVGGGFVGLTTLMANASKVPVVAAVPQAAISAAALAGGIKVYQHGQDPNPPPPSPEESKRKKEEVIKTAQQGAAAGVILISTIKIVKSSRLQALPALARFLSHVQVTKRSLTISVGGSL